jgi:hypothetical protein
MTPTRDRSRPADYRAARLRMKRIWNEGVVKWGHHSQEHMQDEGIDDVDVHHVIKFGKITGHEESEYAGYRYRYVLKGKSVDGFRLRVVIDLDDRMMIVTCFVE